MHCKKTAVFMFCLTFLTLLLLAGCNAEPSYKFSGNPKAKYADVTELFTKSSDVDWKRIKQIKFYNYCVDEGWANLPSKLTLYTADRLGSYKPYDGDVLFESISFKDFLIDDWGYALEWTAADAGVWSGSPMTFDLGKTFNMTDVKTLVFSYELETSVAETGAAGGIRIAFVDNKGNESSNEYISLSATTRK